MSSRSSGLRIKVVAMLLSLVALWIFAATVTLREGVNLLGVSTLGDKLGDADGVAARRVTAGAAAVAGLPRWSRSCGTRGVGVPARADRRGRSRSGRSPRPAARPSAPPATPSSTGSPRPSTPLTSLDGVRSAIDAGTVDRPRAAAMYTDIINSGFRIYGALSTLDDEAIARGVPDPGRAEPGPRGVVAGGRAARPVPSPPAGSARRSTSSSSSSPARSGSCTPRPRPSCPPPTAPATGSSSAGRPSPGSVTSRTLIITKGGPASPVPVDALGLELGRRAGLRRSAEVGAERCRRH